MNWIYNSHRNIHCMKSDVDKQACSMNQGGGSRILKRRLLKKYKQYFTTSEIEVLKKKSLKEVNDAIDLKVGKYK